MSRSAEEHDQGALDHLAVHDRRDALVAGDRGDEGGDGAGQVRPQVAIAHLATSLAQQRGGLGLHGDLACRGDPSQHLVERVVADARDEDLGADAPIERLVGQSGRVEVGGEDDLGEERNLELGAVVEREEVDVTVERHDPPVQELLGSQRLAAEVVDGQHPVVGEHLQRGEVHAGLGLVVEVELVGLHLATDDHARPLAAHPPTVEALGLRLDRLVHHRVVHGDDLAVDLDRVGDQHRVLVGVDHPFGDGRLAGAGGSVQEDGARGVDGRAELVEQLVGDDEVLEALADRVAVDVGTMVLGRHHVGVLGEAHGHGAGVLGRVHPLPGQRASGLAQLQDVAATLGALDLDQPVVAQLLDDLVGEHRRDAHPLGEAHGGGLALAEDASHRDVDDEAWWDAQVLDAQRFGGIGDEHGWTIGTFSGFRSRSHCLLFEAIAVERPRQDSNLRPAD